MSDDEHDMNTKPNSVEGGNTGESAAYKQHGREPCNTSLFLGVLHHCIHFFCVGLPALCGLALWSRDFAAWGDGLVDMSLSGG